MSDEQQLKITEIPLTLAPELWNTLEPDHLQDQTVANLRYVHTDIARSFEKTVLAHRAVMADRYQTPESNMSRSFANTEKVSAAVFEKVEKARARAVEQMAELDYRMSRVPDGPDSVTATALAAALRSTPKAEDRRSIIANALKTDDRMTISAVLFKLPAWASGLTDAERDMYVGEYRATRHPQDLARKAAIRQGLEWLDMGVKSYSLETAKLYDHGRLREAEARAYAARKALENGGV